MELNYLKESCRKEREELDERNWRGSWRGTERGELDAGGSGGGELERELKSGGR